VFDPFAIGDSHNSHANSTSIVKLDESGKVFCPLCLENAPLKEIGKAKDDTYDQYIRNLFESLDQQSEAPQVRKVVLILLELLLKRRTIIIKSDYDFHNILRTLYKVMGSKNYNSNEFSQLAQILAALSQGLVSSSHVSLIPLRKASQKMLDYAKTQLTNMSIEFEPHLHSNTCKFIGGLSLIITTYLGLLAQYTIDEVSDIILPLGDNDLPSIHCRKYYKQSQHEYLESVSKVLIPNLWDSLINLQRSLTVQEILMATKFFDSLLHSLCTAIRLERMDFIETIKEKDCLQLAHSLIYRNTDPDLRQSIRKFLHRYVTFFINLYFGDDETFKQYLKSKDIVETNHKNALTFFSDASRYKRSIFYILVNCVAAKHKSKYFNSTRLSKVIKIIEPQSLNLIASNVLMKSYLYAASAATRQVSQFDSVETFVKRVWKRIVEHSDYDQLNELFCFSYQVFRWVCDNPEFISTARVNMVKFVFEQGSSREELGLFFRVFAKHKSYKILLLEFLKGEDSAMTMVRKFVGAVEDPGHRYAHELNKTVDTEIPTLCNIVMGLFHKSIHECTNENNNYSNLDSVHRLSDMVVTIARDNRGYQITLDEQFVNDLSNFMLRLYDLPSSDRSERILVLINELIVTLIRDNHPCLMTVLKRVSFDLFGIMLDRLADYTRGDRLAESIANLLVSYDELDYPLNYNVRASLGSMALSAFSWMLSSDPNLHILSIMVALEAFVKETHRSTRACLATGLIHMLIKNPKLAQDRIHIRSFLSVLYVEELRYNPLIKKLQGVVTNSVWNEIQKIISITDERPPTPPLSFSSIDSNEFEADNESISIILTQLQEEDVTETAGDLCRVPDSLFVSKSVTDQHFNSDNNSEWLMTAHQATQMNP